MPKKQTEKTAHNTENTYSKSNNKPYSEQRQCLHRSTPKKPTLLIDITAGYLEGRRVPELF